MEYSIEIFIISFLLSFVNSRCLKNSFKLWDFYLCKFFQVLLCSYMLVNDELKKTKSKDKMTSAGTSPTEHSLFALKLQDWTCLRLKQRFKIMTFKQKLFIISIYKTNIPIHKVLHWWVHIESNWWAISGIFLVFIIKLEKLINNINDHISR